jgi:class 3 adenylate cyclase/Flp pilus assembly protein TadD
MNVHQEAVSKTLSVLRQWGWEEGFERLEGEIGGAGAAVLEWLRGLVATRAGAAEVVPPQLQGLEDLPVLLSWARAGQALAALRRKDLESAHERLNRASPTKDCADPVLGATLAHFRGAVLHHQGRADAALPYLHEALELLGKGHFVTCQVLDTLGMVYAAKDNFPAAREFIERAIHCKQAFQDEPGLALSHGQLGRLALDWGDRAEAEYHFQADLDIAERRGDAGSAAQMYNFLGQLALAGGRLAEAGAFLDESIRRARQAAGAPVEGYARKDRALVYLALGEVNRAEEEVRKAEQLFQAGPFAEGLAHVDRVRGRLLRAQGLYDEAERSLWAALAHFQAAGERAETARTQWEMAQVLQARGTPAALVAEALVRALNSAERSRRHVLVGEIEAELRRVDEAAYCRHVYYRARGRRVREDTASLLSGGREVATVMFLDLQGSTDYMRGTDPEVIMLTLNQMMADLAGVLERHGVAVTVYLGDGFMALVRGRDHARRGVAAARDLAKAMAEFNRPRGVLELPLLRARVGLSTGEVFLGNVGTYDKMDFTALGTTVNLAARLQTEAEPGRPCISQATYQQVKGLFPVRDDKGRLVCLKGIGEQQVWDVI